MGPATRNRLAAAALTLGVWGCKDPPGPERVELDRGRVAMPIPAGFVRMPAPEREAIEAARSGRGVELQLMAYVAPPGQDAGSLHVSVVRHTDAHRFYAESVETFVAHMFTAEVEALSKAVGVPLPIRTNETELDVVAHADGQDSSGRSAALDARIEAPSHEEIVERICFCEGSGCVDGSTGCVFQPTKFDVVRPDLALLAGAAPTSTFFPSGCAAAKAPPFYRVASKAEFADAKKGEFARWDSSFEKASTVVDPADASRFVRLGCRTHCAAGEVCDLDALVEKAKADLGRDRPDAKAEVDAAPDGSRTELEITTPRGWERRWFARLKSGAVLEASCECGGAACLVAAGSCRLNALPR